MSFLRCFVIVREKTACILERFGKYHKTLDPGFHLMVPIMDNIAYRQSLKEESISIDDQMAITKDNVTVQIDGTLFVQILDPFKASYKVEQPYEAVRLLALTVLRSEIGKMKLDTLFQERQELNLAINTSVNQACQEWGLTCLRYEILNIEPPQEIKISMQLEAEAERLKRREILISEGKQKAQINIATGKKIAVIKNAEGQAKSLEIISQKEAEGIANIQDSLEQKKDNSQEIVSYLLTQNYLKNYKSTLKKSNVVLTPQGKAGQNSDLMTMAAMMMFQKSHPNGKMDPEQIEQFLKNIQNKKSGSQHALLDAESNYNQMLNKMQYFDDPLLYEDINQNGEKIGDLSLTEDEREEFFENEPNNQQNNSSSSQNSGNQGQNSHSITGNNSNANSYSSYFGYSSTEGNSAAAQNQQGKNYYETHKPV